MESRSNRGKSRELNKELRSAAEDYLHRGWSVIPVVGKEAAVKWGRYRRQRPTAPDLATWFSNGNHYTGIAAVMGAASGGLCCRDFDDPAAFKQWYDTFPDLADTLPTVQTKRGNHVYCRAKPASLAAIRKALGCERGTGAIDLASGELRADAGCIVVLPPSRHPDGHVYRWIRPLPAEIPIVDLCDTGFVAVADRKQATLHSRHKPLPESAVYAESTVFTASTVSTVLHDAVEMAIARTLPTATGQRNRRLFDFARQLKAIAALADADVHAVKSYVVQWHRAALPIIATKPFPETWLDFANAWKSVKYPAGQEPIAMVYQQAIVSRLPPAAEQYEQVELQRLVALCRELQRTAGDKAFFLACRTAAGLLGVSHVQAHRWLEVLKLDSVLKQVSVGTRHKASEYRYIADLCEHLQRPGR